MSKPTGRDGITVRHRRDCAVTRGGVRCRCEPTYQVRVRDPHGGRAVKTFATHGEAVAWRDTMRRRARRGERVTPDRGPRLWDAARRLVIDAEVGEALTRGGERYKPSTIRSYHESLRLHATGPLVRGDLADGRSAPEGPFATHSLGAKRLGDITRDDVRRLLAGITGASRQTRRNLLNAISVVYRHAQQVGDLADGEPIPTRGVKVLGAPPSREHRRPVTANEASMLIATLPEALDRAIWATAFYAGLRSGELRALRWDDVSLGEWQLTVRLSWDRREGPQPPKSRAGERVVPLPQRLRDALLALPHRSGLVLSADGRRPFSESALYTRVKRAWHAAGIDSVTLHQARHTAGMLWRHAGLDIKDVQTFLGHSTIQVTLDTYGWPTPNAVSSSRGLLDEYLA